MWIIVISHFVATSCWSNSFKLNYDACPFLKYRWHSSDRFLQWHLRSGVETLISYSWWRILTACWLKESVDTLPDMMHLSIHLWLSLWPSWNALGKWWKCPSAFTCRSIKKMCMMSGINWKAGGIRLPLIPCRCPGFSLRPFMRDTIMNWTWPTLGAEEAFTQYVQHINALSTARSQERTMWGGFCSLSHSPMAWSRSH